MQTFKFRTLYFGQKSEFRTINVCINISDRSGKNLGGNNLIFLRNTISPGTKIFENCVRNFISHSLYFLETLHLIKFDQ